MLWQGPVMSAPDIKGTAGSSEIANGQWSWNCFLVLLNLLLLTVLIITSDDVSILYTLHLLKLFFIVNHLGSLAGIEMQEREAKIYPYYYKQTSKQTNSSVDTNKVFWAVRF